MTSAPAVREDVYLFVRGTPEEYIAKVKEYNTNSAIVANARRLKDRVDEKLTEEDKQNALSILVGQAVCGCACVWAGVSRVFSGHWEVAGCGGGESYPLHSGSSLRT